MAPIFVERTSGREPDGQFGLDVAQYNRTYVLHEPTGDGREHPIRTQDITGWLKKIVGGTNPGPSPRALGAPGGAGSIDRLMPMCDPQFPSLFADVPTVRIVPMEGYVEDQQGLGPLLAVPPIVTQFARYQAAEIQIPFQARPFALLPNERMVPRYIDYYTESGTLRRHLAYPEWIRWTSRYVDDMDSQISASVGSSMRFRAPDNAPVNGSAYSGIPAMMINDQKLVVKWWAVPIRYVESPNSYLARYKGYVNFDTFMGRPPGSLLFMGAKTAKTYTPPTFERTQQPGAIDGYTGILQGSFFQEPLVDLELTWIWTRRELFSPADEVPAIEIPNPCWIPRGHNLLPCFYNKRFYYAHAATADPNDYANQTPSYLSVSHALLFQDPDVAGVVTAP